MRTLLLCLSLLFAAHVLAPPAWGHPTPHSPITLKWGNGGGVVYVAPGQDFMVPLIAYQEAEGYSGALIAFRYSDYFNGYLFALPGCSWIGQCGGNPCGNAIWQSYWNYGADSSVIQVAELCDIVQHPDVFTRMLPSAEVLNVYLRGSPEPSVQKLYVLRAKFYRGGHAMDLPAIDTLTVIVGNGDVVPLSRQSVGERPAARESNYDVQGRRVDPAAPRSGITFRAGKKRAVVK